MTMNEFNELVWMYGANGDTATTDLNEAQKEVVAMAWSASEGCDTEEASDEAINAYYNDFFKAGK